MFFLGLDNVKIFWRRSCRSQGQDKDQTDEIIRWGINLEYYFFLFINVYVSVNLSFRDFNSISNQLVLLILL